MENQEKVQVNLDASAIEALGGKPLVVELHTTEHNAPTLNEKVNFTKHVMLSGIAELIGKRTFPADVTKNKAILIYSLNPDRPALNFYEDPNDELATVLTSTLKTNPDFLDFKINEGSPFTQNELEQLVRTHAHCFQNVQDAKDLIKNLQNFKIVFEQIIEKKNDNQGNTKDLVETAIKQSEGSVTDELKLAMPLFLGMKRQDFTVEIEIQKDKRSNLPVFGFFSLDVELQKREAAENAILSEVNKLRDKFVCLEVEKVEKVSPVQ